MHRRSLSAARVAALALCVLALHAWLLGGFALRPMAVANVVPVAVPAIAAQSMAVRTLDRGRPPGLTGSANGGTRTLAPQSAGTAEAHAAPRPIEAPPMQPRSKERSPSRAFPPDTQTAAVALPSPPQPLRLPPEVGASPADVPVYATRMPPAFAYAYTLRTGTTTGDVEWRWQPGEGRYEISLEGHGADTRGFTLRSVGSFDTAGIAPLRHTDRRRGRGTLAVNFQRDSGTITFSGPQIEHALAPGVQDRLSWMLQLAAIAAADPARVGPGGGVTMRVVGVRGESDVWAFEPVANETIDLSGGATPTHHLQRSPERPYDTRADVWLDPARDYLPVRVRLSNGADSTLLEWRGVVPAP